MLKVAQMPEKSRVPKVSRKVTEFPNPAQKADLTNIFELLEVIRSIQPAMTVQLAQTLLLVAIRVQASTSEIHHGTQWRISTVSRHLLDLGPRDRHGMEGLGLVEQMPHPTDPRRGFYRLTPKGRELVNRIITTYRKGMNTP